MKRCINPNCQSSFLYGDDKITCPFCHNRLAEGNNVQGARLTPADRAIEIRTPVRRAEHDFVRRSRSCIECHGRVVEIDHHELFNDVKHKLCNSLFRGEPYQLAHQSIEYTIRVENISDNIANEATDFCLYGNYLGRLQVGDEVRIRGKNLGNRRIVKHIYNETTQTEIKPGMQIPAWLVRVGAVSIASFILLFIYELVWMVQSGALVNLGLNLLEAFMPLVIIVFGIWFLLRSVFPGRRRR